MKVILEYFPSYFKEDMKIVKVLKNCKVRLLTIFKALLIVCIQEKLLLIYINTLNLGYLDRYFNV